VWFKIASSTRLGLPHDPRRRAPVLRRRFAARPLRRMLRAAVVFLALANDVLAKGPAPSKGPKTKAVKRNSAMHKKTKSSSGSASAKSSKKRSASFDDEEDDDDDYASYQAMTPYYKPRRKPTGPSVWQRASELAKNAASQAVQTSKLAATKAKVLTTEAATKAHEATRLAKAYYSSDYEQFLLKATWPNDARVEPELAKKLVDSVAHFPARPRTLPQDDPYRVTLRKLWKKMVEKDWRTTTKALYLLHSLSRSTPLKNARALSRTLKSMLADADPKTGRKFFNRRDLVAVKVDAAKEPRKQALVEAYAGYVLRRTLLFAGARFDDVAVPKAKSDDESVCSAADDSLALKRAENALLVLEHALTFVTVALADADGPREAHLVVVSCLELVVHDIKDALRLAAASLSHFAAKRETGVDLSNLVELMDKYAKLRPRLIKALKQASKTLRFFDLRVSLAALDDDAFDAVAARASWAEGLDLPAVTTVADEDEPAEEAAADADDDDDDDESPDDDEASDEPADDDEDDEAEAEDESLDEEEDDDDDEDF